MLDTHNKRQSDFLLCYLVRILQRPLIPPVAQTQTQTHTQNPALHLRLKRKRRPQSIKTRSTQQILQTFHPLFTHTSCTLDLIPTSNPRYLPPRKMAHLLHLVARQVAADGGNEGTIQVPITGTPGHCDTGNEYNGDLGLRISAIFVIMVGSLFGMRNSPLTCMKR